MSDAAFLSSLTLLDLTVPTLHVLDTYVPIPLPLSLDTNAANVLAAATSSFRFPSLTLARQRFWTNI